MDSTISKSKLFCLLWLTHLLIGCATDNTDAVSVTANDGSADGQWVRIPSDSEQAAEIKYFGFVDITLDEEADSQFFEAGFARFDRTIPLSEILSNFKQPAIDSCDFRQQEPGDSTALEFRDELDFREYSYEFVGAGDSVKVVSGGRSYANLTRTSTNPADAVQYETDVGSLPVTIGGLKLGNLLLKTRALRVSAPGDVFPAFSGVVMPPIDEVKQFKPNRSKRISADTQFRWRQGRYSSDPEVRVQIEAGGGGKAIFCAAADDGRFTIPEATKALMQDVSIPGPSAYRDAVWFYLRKDAVLILTQSSYY
ncbi:MAG: hypothetical protein KTR35_04770 [Gammaproteobacteria bacterium]|nr:hypothetical protein [Gammaproteobacteria bacterium]